MPFDDIEVVRHGWERTKEAVNISDQNLFPKLRDRQIMHVRPKGKDGNDTDMLPDGTRITKRCFWLNADYIKAILSK
jgi:hypothetical protein